MQPHSSKAPNVSPVVNINIADHCVHGIIHLGIISSADITKVLLLIICISTKISF